MRIRTHFVVLVLAVLVPVALIVAVTAVRLWQLHQQAHEDDLLARAQALRLAVDTEVAATTRLLQGAADLAPDDAPAATERLRRLVRLDAAVAMAGVAGVDGRVLAHVRAARVAVDATPDAATIRAAVDTRAPVVSGALAASDRSGVFAFVAVPLVRGDAPAAVLYAGFDRQAWTGLLPGDAASAHATLDLLDRNGVLLAHVSGDANAAPATAPLLPPDRTNSDGASRLSGLDGAPSTVAWSTSPATGWTLVATVPDADAGRALLGTSLAAAAGLGAVTLLALLLAMRLGGRVAQAVRSLVPAARSLAQPFAATDEPAHADVAEVGDVRQVLRASADEMQRRDAAAHAARDAAQQANVAKDRFLAMLAHEMRNPLAALSNASAALDHAPASEAEARGRATIHRQAQHLTRIVNDLLDAARVTSGEVVLARHVVDLAVVVVHAVESLKDAGRLTQLTLDMRVEHAPVLGDEMRLAQVVTNLVENAGRYTPPGGRIGLRVGVQDDAVVLSVGDTGAGIEPALLPHVFDLFVQGEHAVDRAPGGLGLGLPAVRRLVELHGGTVTAQSDGPGRGASFEVRLPLCAGHVPDADPAARTPSAPLRIVLVDDHADARESLRALLEQDGHRVDVAADGPSGTARIRAERPDVAFVDLAMPRFDAHSLVRTLRADGPDGVPTLVALSGYGGSDNLADARAAGFDHAFAKPLDIAAFRAWLAMGRVAPLADAVLDDQSR